MNTIYKVSKLSPKITCFADIPTPTTESRISTTTPIPTIQEGKFMHKNILISCFCNYQCDRKVTRPIKIKILIH